jgi:hypothetical protein
MIGFTRFDRRLFPEPLLWVVEVYRYVLWYVLRIYYRSKTKNASTYVDTRARKTWLSSKPKLKTLGAQVLFSVFLLVSGKLVLRI